MGSTKPRTIIGEILLDEHGEAPHDATCPVCPLLQVPADPAEREAWCAEVRRQFNAAPAARREAQTA